MRPGTVKWPGVQEALAAVGRSRMTTADVVIRETRAAYPELLAGVSDGDAMHVAYLTSIGFRLPDNAPAMALFLAKVAHLQSGASGANGPADLEQFAQLLAGFELTDAEGMAATAEYTRLVAALADHLGAMAATHHEPPPGVQ